MLRRIGTHLQPQQARGIADFAAAENDVAVVYRLAAACQTAVAKAVCAVFYDNVGVAAVIRVLIRPRAFAAFQCHGIVVDGHITVFHQYIAADVNIDRIAARCFHRGGRSENMEIQQLYVIAAVDMRSPERRVHKAYSGDLYIVTVGDVNQAGAQLVHIGTFRDNLPAQPERFPVPVPVAVDCAFAGNGKSVNLVGIYQCGEVFQALSFYAGVDNGEVADVVTSFQHCTFFHV